MIINIICFVLGMVVMAVLINYWINYLHAKLQIQASNKVDQHHREIMDNLQQRGVLAERQIEALNNISERLGIR